MLNLDPQSDIYRQAITLGYANPNAMSKGQLLRVMQALTGTLPVVAPSPFQPVPMPGELQQIADHKVAGDLIFKVGAAMTRTSGAAQDLSTAKWEVLVAGVTQYFDQGNTSPYMESVMLGGTQSADQAAIAVQQFAQGRPIGEGVFLPITAPPGWDVKTGRYTNPEAMMDGLWDYLRDVIAWRATIGQPTQTTSAQLLAQLQKSWPVADAVVNV